MNGEIPNVFELQYLNLSVDEIKDLMCKARQPTSSNRNGENRDTALIDPFEDKTQLPDPLEQQFIKEDIRELINGCRKCKLL